MINNENALDTDLNIKMEFDRLDTEKASNCHQKERAGRKVLINLYKAAIDHG